MSLNPLDAFGCIYDAQRSIRSGNEYCPIPLVFVTILTPMFPISRSVFGDKTSCETNKTNSFSIMRQFRRPNLVERFSDFEIMAGFHHESQTRSRGLFSRTGQKTR